MGNKLPMYVNNVKYIGHTIENCFGDNEDVNRQLKYVLEPICSQKSLHSVMIM